MNERKEIQKKMTNLEMAIEICKRSYSSGVSSNYSFNASKIDIIFSAYTRLSLDKSERIDDVKETIKGLLSGCKFLVKELEELNKKL